MNDGVSICIMCKQLDYVDMYPPLVDCYGISRPLNWHHLRWSTHTAGYWLYVITIMKLCG